jgi:pimeloyl-ACP methyl ester carboxylesterase
MRVAEPLAAAGFRVLAFDHRGHGLSDHVGAGGYYHFPDYLTDLQAVLEDLSIERVSLVGHSMGGTVAGLFAGLRPERVDRLVLVEGLGPPPGDDAAAVVQMDKHLSHLVAVAPHKVFASLDEVVTRLKRFTPKLDDSLAWFLAERGTRSVEGGKIWRWDPLHRTRAATAYDIDRHMAVLRRITAPTTLLYGSESWYLKMARLQEREAAVRAVDRQVFHAGHAVHIDAADSVAKAISAALERL